MNYPCGDATTMVAGGPVRGAAIGRPRTDLW